MENHIHWLLSYCMFTVANVIMGKRFFSSPNAQSGSLAQAASSPPSSAEVMNGAVPLLPVCALMACTGTILPLHLQHL
jgi:hypothetical protein